MKGLPHRWIISSMGDHRWDEMKMMKKMDWDNNEEYCCCSGDLPLGPQSQRFRLFLSFDLRLQLSGFHRSATSKTSSFLKVLEKSPVCGSEPFQMFQQSGRPDEQNQHVGIFLPGSLRHYSVSPEQEKDRNSNPSVSPLQIPIRMCRRWFGPSSCVWLRCGSSSPPSTPPAAPCSTQDGSPSSLLWSSAGVCVCLVFWRTKNSCPESAPPSVWFAWWLIP